MVLIMAQIELPDGIKITLDSRELLALLKDYKSQSPASVAKNETIQQALISPAAMPIKGSTPVTPGELPKVGDIVKSLEKKGFPFTHTIYEEFVNQFQTTPRKNGTLYRQFRNALKDAADQLASRYNGHWESKSISMDKKSSKEFWLVRNEIENAQENSNQD
jgi:hypothetical protein